MFGFHTRSGNFTRSMEGNEDTETSVALISFYVNKRTKITMKQSLTLLITPFS